MVQATSRTQPTAHNRMRKADAEAPVHLLLQARQPGIVAVALRVLALQLRRQRSNSACAFQADAGFQPADDGQGVTPSVRLLADREGDEQVDPRCRGEDGGEIERCRQYADHDCRLVVERDRAPDDRGVGAEAALPRP